jgi:hypothetical protein
MPKFDWMQGTIEDYPRVITDALMSLPGAHDLKHGRGRLNYHESAVGLGIDGHARFTLLHGGPNGAPNAFASGEFAEPFTQLIRAHWPTAHRVSRLDSAQDVKMPFLEAHRACQAIATEMRVRGSSVVPDDPQDGATYYMGAPSSRARIRVYEKGKQLRAQGDLEADLDVLRFELQLRPNDPQAKIKAASIGAGEVWGATPLARRVAGVFEHDVERVIMQQRLRSTYESRTSAILKQYGGHFYEMLARHGSWELVGEQIGLDLESR